MTTFASDSAPPNRGYTCDPTTGVPLQSSFDAGVLPAGSSKCLHALGSHDDSSGQPFQIIDVRTKHRYGWAGPETRKLERKK